MLVSSIVPVSSVVLVSSTTASVTEGSAPLSPVPSPVVSFGAPPSDSSTSNTGGFTSKGVSKSGSPISTGGSSGGIIVGSSMSGMSGCSPVGVTTSPLESVTTTSPVSVFSTSTVDCPVIGSIPVSISNSLILPTDAAISFIEGAFAPYSPEAILVNTLIP